MSTWTKLMERARQRLASARDDLTSARYDVGYESARAAAELAGKAMMLAKLGSYPSKDHNVAGPLAQAKLIPADVSPKELSRLLDDYARGDYGFDRPVEARELRAALRLAERMIDEADARGPPG